MKNLLTLLFLLFITSAQAQNTAANSPVDRSNMVKFNTLDGTTESAYYIPSDSTTGNVLIIFHEQWGLNTDVKKEAQKWKGMLGNVDVYAIDMYSGKITSDPLTAAKYIQELNEKRAENIIKGLLSHMRYADKRIVTLGWGEGARWAFKGAVLAGNNGIGCVMYYGAPEKEEKNVRALKGDVVYNWASLDKYNQKAFVEDFGRLVVKAGRKFEMYPLNAEPGFADPSNPKHDGVLTAEADKHSLIFIRSKLQLE